MRLSKRQLALAAQLGKRLAAGEERALQDIESVVRPYLLKAHAQQGEKIISAILWATLSEEALDRYCDKVQQRIDRYQAEGHTALLRDETQMASIRMLFAPGKIDTRGE